MLVLTWFEVRLSLLYLSTANVAIDIRGSPFVRFLVFRSGRINLLRCLLHHLWNIDSYIPLLVLIAILRSWLRRLTLWAIIFIIIITLIRLNYDRVIRQVVAVVVVGVLVERLGGGRRGQIILGDLRWSRKLQLLLVLSLIWRNCESLLIKPMNALDIAKFIDFCHVRCRYLLDWNMS